MEALHAPMQKNAVEQVRTEKSLGFFDRLFLVPKRNNWWRPVLELNTVHIYLKKQKKIQNGNTGNYKDLSSTRGVGNIHRLQGHLFPQCNKQPVNEIPMFLHSRSFLPIQSTTICSIHSPMEFTVVVKEIKLIALPK